MRFEPIVFVLFFLLTVSSFAQQDTTVVYDTVYQVKEPVVIRDTVYVQKDESQVKGNWSAALATDYFWSGGASKTSMTGTGANIGINVRRQVFERFQFSAGIGFSRWKDNFRYTEISEKQHKESYTYQDTLGYYLHCSNGTCDSQYVTEERTEEHTVTRKDTSESIRNETVSYLEIPVQVAYEQRWKMFVLKPFAGMILNTVISSSNMGEGLGYNHINVTMNVGSSFGIVIKEKFQMAVKYTYRTTAGSVLTERKTSRTSHGIGITGSYIF